jgi:hypothetical protein
VAVLLDGTMFVYLTALREAYKDAVRAAAIEGVI